MRVARSLSGTTRRRPAQGRAGFTLLELMIIVVIIGILTTLAGPGLAGWFARNRAQRGFYDVLRISRHARSAPIAEGRVYRLRVVDGLAGRRRVEIWRGTSNLCSTTPWNLVMAPACEATGDCVDAADMAAYSVNATDYVDVEPGGAFFGLCWQPDGRMLAATSADVLPVWIDPANGAAQLDVQRYQGGSPEGPVRRVVFPSFGSPREWR